MNHTIIRTLTITATALAFVTSTFAAEEGHGREHSEKAPATLDTLWKAIDAEHKELRDFVETGTLDKLDEPAHHLTPFLKALPDKTADLPEDKQKRVQGMVNNALKALDDLHHAAHDGDTKAAKARLRTFDSVMKALKNQVAER